MTHQIVMATDCFPLCYEGVKEFELKVYSDDVKNYKDNDTMEIYDELTGSYFVAVITRLTYFNSLEEVFDFYDYSSFIPYAFSKEHIITMYESSENFKMGVMNHGLLCFKITRICELID